MKAVAMIDNKGDISTSWIQQEIRALGLNCNHFYHNHMIITHPGNF